MSKHLRHHTRSKILERKAGKRPGYLFVPAEAIAPRFFLISYSEDSFEEREYTSYNQLRQYVFSHPEEKHWIDIRGYGDLDLLESLIEDFDIHRLQMEDVINDYQRPKVEEDNGRLFVITRMLRWVAEQHILEDVQLSMFTGPNYVLTLQSDYKDCLDPLRERIRTGRGVIRQRPVPYLLYALMDVVLDFYFPVIGEVSSYIEELEQAILDKPSRQTLRDVLALKNELVKLRRITWPQRDIMNDLLRMEDDIIPENIKLYFRDAYDHTIQLIDLIESHREIASSQVELYMSTVSNRMNEIMKVLTIISSIFIPLSFIVGLYGMNFAHQNPETGQVYPMSMPELYQPYAYPLLLAFMAILILVQLYFFFRRGWFRSF